jgi:hypothetical protein
LNERTTTEEERAASWGELGLGFDVYLHQVTEAQFAALVFRRGFAHLTQQHWHTDAASLEPVLPYALATSRNESGRSAVLDLERVVGGPCIAKVGLHSETLYARVAAAEQPALADAERWLRATFTPMDRDDESAPRVPVSFWSYGSCAGEIARSISVPIWDQIAGNYPRRVRAGLERLYSPGFRPSDGGQLVLWHGDPGTGKTYALRALAWAWRHWCDLNYVTDPENFFGMRADYMMEVLLEEEDDDESKRWRACPERPPGRRRSGPAHARAPLCADARRRAARVGQPAAAHRLRSLSAAARAASRPLRSS